MVVVGVDFGVRLPVATPCLCHSLNVPCRPSVFFSIIGADDSTHHTGLPGGASESVNLTPKKRSIDVCSLKILMI